MARRSLLPERNSYFGKTDVRIEWAHPKISITNVVCTSLNFIFYLYSNIHLDFVYTI